MIMLLAAYLLGRRLPSLAEARHIERAEPVVERKAKVRKLLWFAASRSGTRTGRRLRLSKNDRALLWIIEHESSFYPRSRDRRSSAFGLAGFLNGSWKDVGIARTHDPLKQIEAMFRYIDKRYHGNPTEAYGFWRKRGYY